jgi:hypothetical protein
LRKFAKTGTREHPQKGGLAVLCARVAEREFGKSVTVIAEREM